MFDEGGECILVSSLAICVMVVTRLYRRRLVLARRYVPAKAGTYSDNEADLQVSERSGWMQWSVLRDALSRAVLRMRDSQMIDDLYDGEVTAARPRAPKRLAFWRRELIELTLLLPAVADHQAGEVARKAQ